VLASVGLGTIDILLGVTIKERLHQAVDTMTDEEAAVALRALAELSGDPVAWTLDHAPLDDEPETEEERRAVADVRADRERGIKPIPLEDVRAEFGGA
jgi:hypothetical protein